jgi:hypothetical protein
LSSFQEDHEVALIDVYLKHSDVLINLLMDRVLMNNDLIAGTIEKIVVVFEILEICHSGFPAIPYAICVLLWSVYIYEPIFYNRTRDICNDQLRICACAYELQNTMHLEMGFEI